MSRVGKHPIRIPASVQVAMSDGTFTGKSSLGQFSMSVPEEVVVSIDGQAVTVTPANDSKPSRVLWGTIRAQLANRIAGLEKPFVQKVDLVGVGYRAAVQGSELVLTLGYSHDVRFPIPEGVTIVCEKPTTIAVSSVSKQRVGQIVREIQAFRKPEPYKGKGIIKEGQFVYRKEGKKK